MKLEDFNFHLPLELIARFPAQKRDHSRLLVVERQSGRITHHVFKDLVDMVGPDDFLVMNNSRVIPAKFFGRIGESQVEFLVVRTVDDHTVEALTLPAKKFKLGARVYPGRTGTELWAEVVEIGSRGKRTLRFNTHKDDFFKSGYAPLPPYIKRKFEEAEANRDLDLQRYQTIYSHKPGSIAAPTAGLHFTPELLAAIEKKCERLEVTLNVGEATFQKIDVEKIKDHRMGREYITVPNETRKRIEALKKDQKKLLAVGTTTVRSLETLALQGPGVEDFYSELFIYPGFRFKLVDKMVTNLHLPQSSLFILVSAFAGLELMQEAYRIAVAEKYRFFSYGDAMLIL